MAKYKVTAKSGLNVRSGPSMSDAILGAYVKGTIFNSPDNETNQGWVKIDKPLSGWASLSYLECIEKQEVSDGSNQKAIENSIAGNSTNQAYEKSEYTENELKKDSSVQVKTPTTATEDDLYLRYIRAYGIPPQFTSYTDPPLYTASQGNYSVFTSCGRVFAESLLASPSLLSICPCNIKYLPGWTIGEKDQFFDRLVDAVKVADSGLASRISNDKNLSGRLYEAVPAYGEFMDHYNVVCRIASILLGLGNTVMPGTNVPLKTFDYSYFTTPLKSTAGLGLFDQVKTTVGNNISAAINDDHYIHFFLNQSGTSVSESMSNNAENTPIEDLFDQSGLSQITKNIQLLMGYTDPDTNMMNDIQSVFDSSNYNFVRSFGSMAANYLKGGKIVFPQMLSGSTYDKSISATCTFISPYGNKLSVFLYCIVPALALLCLTLPKQISENMYSIPFLCRVKQPGSYNSDMSFIHSLDIKRGGPDDNCWTIDGLSTYWECSFSITPMYSKLMMPSAKHPFLTFGNSAMLEYLGVLCGIDLKANNIDEKISVATSLLGGWYQDQTSNLGRNLLEKISSSFSSFFHILNP